jgi:hypothetical protein
VGQAAGEHDVAVEDRADRVDEGEVLDPLRRPLGLVLLVLLPAYVVFRSIAITEATPRAVTLPGGEVIASTMRGALSRSLYVGRATEIVAQRSEHLARCCPLIGNDQQLALGAAVNARFVIELQTRIMDAQRFV